MKLVNFGRWYPAIGEHEGGFMRIWVFFLMLLLPISLFAQKNGSIYDLSLQELMDVQIYSAGKKAEKVQDIPASVYIITRDDIERAGYSTLEELIMHVPGLFHIDDYEDFKVGFRGTLGGSYAVMLNGVILHPNRIKAMSIPGRSLFHIPIESIDRIEIVKGPMSVIYGNNAFFGSINIVTNDIREKNSGQVVLSGGSGSTGKGFVRAGTIFQGGSMALNAGWYHSDGIRQPYPPELLTDPLMKRELDTLGHNNYNVDLSWNYCGLVVDARFSRMNYGFYTFSPHFHQGNDLLLTQYHAAISYQADIRPNWNWKGLVIFSEESYDVDFDFMTPADSGGQMQRSRRIEAELVTNYRFLRQLTWTVGAQARYLFGIENEFTIQDIEYNRHYTSDSIFSLDLFSQVDWKINRRLEAVLGGRLAFVDGYSIDGSGYEGTEIYDQVYKYQERYLFTPRASLIYRLNKRHVTKWIYGQAYQTNRSRDVSDPEQIQTYEVDYLALFPKWQMTTALYYNSIGKILRVSQQYDGIGYVRKEDNSGKWESYGVEISLIGRPAVGWQIKASYGYQITKDENNPEIAVGNSPVQLAKFAFSYSLQSFSVQMDGLYTDVMYSDWQWDEGTTVTAGDYTRLGQQSDPYFLMGVNARYVHALSGIFLNIRVFNLFDQKYRYPASELVSFTKGGLGIERRILVSAGWNF